MSSIKQQDITRAFGKALRALRERSGFTQDGLSDRGISRTHIIAMEKGTSDPKLTSLVKLAAALGVPFMALAREIDRAMTDPLAVITERNIGEDAVLLDDGILLVSPRGSLNALVAMPFFVQIFELAQARGAHKILLNVIDMHMDMSMVERHQLSVDMTAWLNEHSFAPSLATVVLPSSGVGPGADMVRKHGVNVRVFFKQSEALEWLRSLAD